MATIKTGLSEVCAETDVEAIKGCIMVGIEVDAYRIRGAKGVGALVRHCATHS